MNGYEELAAAIVARAVQDYRMALKYLKKHPRRSRRRTKFENLKHDCERFFTGDWIRELTDVDGRKIMEKIQEDVEKGD